MCYIACQGSLQMLWKAYEPSCRKTILGYLCGPNWFVLYPSKLKDSPCTSKAVAGQGDAALLLWTEEAKPKYVISRCWRNKRKNMLET